MVQVEGEGAAGEGPVGAVAGVFGDVGAWVGMSAGVWPKRGLVVVLGEGGEREGEGDLQG